MPANGLSPWKQLVFDNWALLDQLARKRFPDPNLADEALLFVQTGLEKNDWQRLRSFQGTSSLKTYLAHVACRLLEDFARSKFGRIRIPLWITRLGPLWEQLYRLLCCEHLTVADAVCSLTASPPDTRDPEYVQEAAFEILSRVTDCGSGHGQARTADPDALEKLAPEDPQAHQHSPEECQRQREAAAFIEAFRVCLGLGEDGCHDFDADKAGQFLGLLREQIRLSGEETLLLRLVYQEGLTVGAAGRRLGINVFQAHGRLRRLLARLRAGVSAVAMRCGLRADLSELGL